MEDTVPTDVQIFGSILHDAWPFAALWRSRDGAPWPTIQVSEEQSGQSHLEVRRLCFKSLFSALTIFFPESYFSPGVALKNGGLSKYSNLGYSCFKISEFIIVHVFMF